METCQVAVDAIDIDAIMSISESISRDIMSSGGVLCIVEHI